MMSDVKQVKVDNWGIYFLQRLKHFFNRTDYCDLTLQFQDNAQLKVHRLVLNACTEYFELLERTCEMYEDCLVMPEDLQADVVVPIVNFMYTGQLEFRMDALERLYQTSQIMNMPVLSKLLDAHRSNHNKISNHGFASIRRHNKEGESFRQSKYTSPTPSTSGKRSYSKAFESNKITPNSKSTDNRRPSVNKFIDKGTPSNNSNDLIVYRDKKLYLPLNKQSSKSGEGTYRVPSPIPLDSSLYNKKLVLGEPRPTRYELPEELDTDNVFDNSFTNISYTSQPLMVHPDTTKQYSKKKSTNVFNEASSSKKSFTNRTVDIVECKKVSNNDNIFEDDGIQNAPDDDLYQPAFLSMKDEVPKDPGQLFDQILDNNEGPKVTIETKDKQASNLDHAKIISEVLKKYPHLVKSNKNIKLKILNTPPKGKKTRPPSVPLEDEKLKEVKTELAFTYETDVLDSKEAAKLISMGAENVRGPWICLICGTPGRALNFSTYYNFRRHLVEVHKEKPVSTICEHCGLKSFKRNYLLHHIYTKHGVPPPPQYHFPKCPMCDYIALTEGFLVKHKLTHTDLKLPAVRSNLRCLVCSKGFGTTNQLLLHIQKTGHKQHATSPDKKPSIQCSYCMKVFLRDSNFYCHLKTSHKEQAVRDGIIDDSDDEKPLEDPFRTIHEMRSNIKHEHSGYENELEDEEMNYQIQKRPDVNVNVCKKPRLSNNKILNSGFANSVVKQINKSKIVSDVNTEFVQEIDSPSHVSEGNIVVINDIEYIMKDNQLIPRKSTMKQNTNDEFILSDMMDSEEAVHRLQNLENVTPTTSMELGNMDTTEIVQPKMVLKKTATLNQPIQIVVSNEEEYKALMSSNHSIIFDNGDTNKTLTVLTAPQNTSLDTTTIDLDNTQSNDMMIIQEDYPLNVSEAGDNSKYVVVYSHPMDQDDPNKQYQIITSQDIGAQYVQSSGVLTQNYDTITTPTSVVTANVIGTQMDQSWAPNSEDNVDNQTAILVAPESELPSLTQAEQTNGKQNVSENVLVGLPDTEILRMPAKSSLVQLTQITNDVDSVNNVNLETIPTDLPQQIVADDNQSNTMQESTNIEIPDDTMTNKEITIMDETQITADHEVETECQNDMNVADLVEEPTEVSQPEQQPTEALSSTQQPQEPLSEKEQSTLLIQETTEVLSSIEHSEKDNDESHPVIDENLSTDNNETGSTSIIEKLTHDKKNTTVQDAPINVEKVNIPIVETKEEIENLTSEWSEDEYETVLEAPESNKSKINTKSENPITQEPELEESIENIQHEVEKQFCDTDDLKTDVENVDSQKEDVSNIDQSKSSQQNTVIVNTEATQEKISSLLNDWEDNDSQEEVENTSINENGDDNSTASEPTNSNQNDAKLGADANSNDKTEPKKEDNIKSLVSDWDDDEEEIKEKIEHVDH